jgi:superfamily II DNA/RNA helicase
MSSFDNPPNVEYPEENADNLKQSYDEINDWDTLEISSSLLRGIYAMGFERPSPIQSKAIPAIIDNRDVIAQAQSGTGKTATFSIGILNKIDTTKDETQALVLSPTRELAQQSASVISRLGNFMPNLRVQTQFGGQNNDNNTKTFNFTNNPHIICGCPGRVFDIIKKGRLDTKFIKIIVIDEADEMLSFGFKDQIYNIFKNLEEEIQILLISATLPTFVYPIINAIMRNPISIRVQNDMLTLEGIKQYYVTLDNDKNKYLTLKDLFKHISLNQCIIYCNSVKRVSDLADAMKEDGFPVSCLHSQMDKAARNKAFDEFKTGTSRVLISSNVTARGIDIQQVSIVINFDIPKNVSTYLHRIGRSGRWGRKGIGINFITVFDVAKMREIENYYKCQISQLPNDPDVFKF